MKLFTTIAAVLALALLPAAAEARGDHSGHDGARAHGKAGRGAVRSFRAGVLTTRLAGGRPRPAEVTDDTDFSCRSARAEARKRRAAARRRRARARARAATKNHDEADE